MLPNDIVEYILSFLPWYEYFDAIPNINIKLFFKRYKQSAIFGGLTICYLCRQEKEYTILVDHLCTIRRQSKKHLRQALSMCARNGHYDTFLLLRDKFGAKVNNYTYEMAVRGAINGYDAVISLFDHHICNDRHVYEVVIESGNVPLLKSIKIGNIKKYINQQYIFDKLLKERKYEMLIHLYENNRFYDTYFYENVFKISDVIWGLCKDGRHELLKYVHVRDLCHARFVIRENMDKWVDIAEKHNQYHLIITKKFGDDGTWPIFKMKVLDL